MEIILRPAVDNVGKPGDVVNVSNGYARNYRIPRGLAFPATEGNKKRIATEKARLEAAENERISVAQELAGRLEQVSLTISATGKLSVDEYEDRDAQIAREQASLHGCGASRSPTPRTVSIQRGSPSFFRTEAT